MWLSNCRRSDILNLNKGHIICDVHFEAKMFSNYMRNRLHKHAIPTIFNKSNEQTSHTETTNFDVLIVLVQTVIMMKTMLSPLQYQLHFHRPYPLVRLQVKMLLLQFILLKYFQYHLLFQHPRHVFLPIALF